MKVLVSFTLLAAGHLFAATLPVTAIPKLLKDAHAAGNFDGVVVITQHGQVLYAGAAGQANRAAGIANTPATLFRLASLTKQVTALLVMQEVAAGRLALNTPASAVLPALPPPAGRVTVLQLLQHLSGLSNPSDGPDDVMPPFYTRTGKDVDDMSKNALGACAGPAKREPGVQFEYNNCDYIVLGALLEKLNGKPYRALLKDRVIQPLGLKSWGLFSSAPKENPVVALGYRKDGSLEAFQNVAAYGSSGALYGTALDVAKWDAALLQNKLLSADLTATMFRADPKLYGEALGSWAYDSATPTGKLHVIERQGDIGGSKSLNLLLPDRDASVVILSNTERADLFDTYSKKGFGYAILQALSQ